MKTKQTFKLSLAAMAGAVMLGSCSNDKYHYDENYAKEVALAEYAANFKSTFGDYSNVSSWDFSSGKTQLATRAGENDVTCTPVEGLKFGVKSYVSTTVGTDPYNSNNKNYLVKSNLTANEALQSELATSLFDGSTHTGTAAVLVAPGNSFTVYPVSAQGLYKYDLVVRITDHENGEKVSEFTVFSKDWTEYKQAYLNGMGIEYTRSTNYAPRKVGGGLWGWGNPDNRQPDPHENDNQNSSTSTTTKPNQNGNAYGFPQGGDASTDGMSGYTVSKYVNMPGATFTAPVGSSIDIYVKLHNTAGNNSLEGQTYGTHNGHAVVLSCSVRPDSIPESIMPEDAEIKYIGIEDDGSQNSDYDFNDLTLLVIGNKQVPDRKYITTDSIYSIELAKPCKRYMIEDLGTTDDFDFNDLVLDVESVDSATYKATFVNGTITKTEKISQKSVQKAFVRAMGGTKDFTIKIGNTTWKKSANDFVASKMYNTTEGSIDTETPLATIQLNDGDWDSTTNNVVVTVDGSDATDATTITFGEAGKAPLMIATDRDQEWSAERVDATWIKDKMKQAQ